MQVKYQKAFTMLELTFVIVIIGILSAVAIPKFSNTTEGAHSVQAQSTLTTVRTALATERQKRILRGDFSGITDLGLSSGGTASGYVFDHFSKDQNNQYTAIFDYPFSACASGQVGCWSRTDATHYVYKFVTGGDAKFVLTNNKLNCDNDAVDCKKITR